MSNNIQFKEAFAKKLVTLRESQWKTQKVIAKQLEIPRSRYAAYEEARAEPPIETLKKLAELYGQTLDDLVNTATTNKA